MPRVTIAATKGTAQPHGVRATLVQVSILDGIWAISCNGDAVGHECPGDIEPGDTWSDLGACVTDAMSHVATHEARGWS